MPLQARTRLQKKSLVRKPTKLSRKPLKRVQVKIKPKGVSKLLKEADAVFSRFVRVSHAKDGIAECYTCGHKADIKKLQNGHYISRYYKKYRFDERNCRVQCSMCNMWKSGDIPTFRKKLIAEIGREEVESMESDYKELYRLTPEYLTEIIRKYKALLEELELSTSS